MALVGDFLGFSRAQIPFGSFWIAKTKGFVFIHSEELLRTGLLKCGSRCPKGCVLLARFWGFNGRMG